MMVHQQAYFKLKYKLQILFAKFEKINKNF